MRLKVTLAVLSVTVTCALHSQTQLQLIPQPREMQLEGSVPVRSGITIARPTNAEDRFAAIDLANSLKERGIRVNPPESGSGPRVVLMRLDGSGAKSVLQRHTLTFDPAMRDEGYII